MHRKLLPWVLGLGAVAIASSVPADYTNDPVSQGFGGLTLTASTGIAYPQVDEPANGGTVVEQSDSWHYVKVANGYEEAWAGNVDYRMGLYHDGSPTPHSTKNGTNEPISVPAMDHRTILADLRKEFTIPIGAHSVTAEADIRMAGAGNPWVVAYGHTHNYTRQN